MIHHMSFAVRDTAHVAAVLAELIDGAVLEVVPGSHLFPFTHAAAIAARISGFLEQAPPAARAAA